MKVLGGSCFMSRSSNLGRTSAFHAGDAGSIPVRDTKKSCELFGSIKYCIFICTQYRGVEQLVARQAHNLEVTGSSPVAATKNKKHHAYKSNYSGK